MIGMQHSSKANPEKNTGFTLVELSIVMIIIGLLIGGVFGGIKLVENAQINKTIQDLKSIESSALTFRDTYGRLPGDLRRANERLPNCVAPDPCSFSGDGNRRIGPDTAHPPVATLSPATSDERFVFWHHLSAAGLVSLVQPITDPEFGAGQPLLPVGDGLRIVYAPIAFGARTTITNHYLTSTVTNAAHPNATGALPVNIIRSIDIKMDDGLPNVGLFMNGWQCNNPNNSPAASVTYATAGDNCAFIKFLGF